MISVRENSAKSTLVVRLERNQREVRQLMSKLNSYICEPTTYSLFERIESLKSSLNQLNDRNREILTSLKEHKKSIEDYVDRVKQQFIEFHELQEGVDEYIRGARSY